MRSVTECGMRLQGPLEWLARIDPDSCSNRCDPTIRANRRMYAALHGLGHDKSSSLVPVGTRRFKPSCRATWLDLPTAALCTLLRVW
jgi:hypothetical protein